MKQSRSYGPTPSVAEPRRPLLLAVRSFVRTARDCPGVLGIALLGSLTTTKLIPKDADLLVTIDESIQLAELAHAGRRLQGFAQTINLGADIFLANEDGGYVGRICHYRKTAAAASTSTTIFRSSHYRKSLLQGRRSPFGLKLSDASRCHRMWKHSC
jgi:hypothetical protein